MDILKKETENNVGNLNQIKWDLDKKILLEEGILR